MNSSDSWHLEDQLDAIRVRLYEENKHKNNADVAASTNKMAKKIAKQYGFQIVKRHDQAM